MKQKFKYGDVVKTLQGTIGTIINYYHIGKRIVYVVKYNFGFIGRWYANDLIKC